MSAGWVAGAVGTFVAVLALLSSDARAEAAEMGGLLRVFLGYVLAALVCGLTLGLLRPTATDSEAKRFVGGILTAEAFCVFLTVLLGREFWGSLGMVLLTGGIAFVIGFVLAPIWYSGSIWMPDFDSWVAGSGGGSGSSDGPDDAGRAV